MRLRDAGHLYEDTYAGLYCTGCEQFYAESDLEQPGNICPLHKTPVEWLEEENTFFRLSAFTDRCSSSTTATPSTSCRAPATTRPGRRSRPG